MRPRNDNWTNREADLLNRLERARDEGGILKERLRRTAADLGKLQRKSARIAVTIDTRHG
jgi:hypothetical protein